MHSFQDGEKAAIFQRGTKVEVTVFSRSGDFVYVFDRENRLYQFQAHDLIAGSPHDFDHVQHELTSRRAE